jgi:hypothetical protein
MSSRQTRTLGAGAALLTCLGVLGPVSAASAGQPAAPAGQLAAGQLGSPVEAATVKAVVAGADDGSRMLMAAIAGAGIEVRHTMKVRGPDPAIGAALGIAPSGKPGAPAKASTPAVRPAAATTPIGRGWHSGASGDTAQNGSFGNWRGKPLQIVGTWADTSGAAQTRVDVLDAYSGWNGDVDVATGGLLAGESWSAAANGAYMSRWTQAVRNIRAKRAGKSGTTYIRFAHEMTGDWFNWKVNSGNVSAFKTAWRMYFAMVRREFPQAKLVFSPNEGNHSGVPFDQIWPGDGYVDVLGPDIYDGFPYKSSQSLWDSALTVTNDGPQGLTTWLAFAKSHHVPLAFPEWGLREVDDPVFVKGIHDFLASCAPRAGDTDLSGKCIYDIYFNLSFGGSSSYLIYGGPNTKAPPVYRSLTWGS